ncbi:MAG: formate dehydrogenase accessory sulfurtransferase FdhD [Bacteroidota bacterium]
MEDTKQLQNMASGKIFGTRLLRVNDHGHTEDLDYVVVEEPVEIMVEHGPANERESTSVSITMRTPGHDDLLATGFLYSEGLISRREEITEISVTSEAASNKGNRVVVSLTTDATFDVASLSRNFYMTSSCGVCGKASIDALRMHNLPFLENGQPRFDSSFFHRLPEILLDEQRVFEHTGGLHAAALFDRDGKLVSLKEDVGRHNAVDKLIGESLLNEKLPLNNFVILVSGRISFELVQKALMAGLPVMAAVGAPSSLAIQLASRFGMTLIGFIRDGRYNIYSGRDRVFETIVKSKS